MKKNLIFILIISFLVLGACDNNFMGNDKENNNNDNNQTTKKNENERKEDKQSENNFNYENNNQLSENEAIEKAKEVFKSGVYHDFKVDLDRSDDAEYFITFLLNDAVGTPQSSATTVNRITGEVGDYIDDRTEEEIENYINFIRESPKYKGSSKKLEELAKKDRTRPNDEIMERNNSEQQNPTQSEQDNQPLTKEEISKKIKNGENLNGVVDADGDTWHQVSGNGDGVGYEKPDGTFCGMGGCKTPEEQEKIKKDNEKKKEDEQKNDNQPKQEMDDHQDVDKDE